MQCAQCQEAIDDDSCFCDQCGAEVKTCVACKRPGKGKRCTACGGQLVAVRAEATSAIQTPTVSAAIAPPPAPTQTPDPAANPSATRRLDVAEAKQAANPELRLLNKTLNVDLKIDDNTIIGRTTGQYVAVFGRFDQVSSKHCSFTYHPRQGWCVTDLGSTNKTHYNNDALMPNTPQILKDQTYLKIANIEFFVRVITH